jgi:hypothetical protein
MECLAVSKLPDGPQWIYEIKLDGYRAEAISSAEGRLVLPQRQEPTGLSDFRLFVCLYGVLRFLERERAKVLDSQLFEDVLKHCEGMV